MRHLNHNLSDFDSIKAERKIRRWLSKIGDNSKWLNELFMLWKADVIATGKECSVELANIDRIIALIAKVKAEKQPFSTKDLKVNGHDLIEIGVPANESMAITFKALLTKVIENPELNNRDTLLAMAKEMNSPNGKFHF
jgi:tRNA nucleotidyltransferase (CCA-adding enzyme)